MLQVSSYKLMHWLNVRKLTPALVAERSRMSLEDVTHLLDGRRKTLSEAEAEHLANALNVNLNQFAEDGTAQEGVIYKSLEELLRSRHPIRRDGIHFYNYYSLPSPKGQIAPVILDILCPKERLPKLNRGHLEPAITVNIGPGSIHGRWGEELNELNWRVMEANKGGDYEWIVGDSYIEPSFCPHSYSLNTDEPARIISYTCKSNLEALLMDSNEWPDEAFETMVRQVSNGPPASSMLKAHMERRGYDAETLAAALPLNPRAIAAYLEGDRSSLKEDELKSISEFLGLDYRLLMPPSHRHDATGKTYFSIQNSIATVRPFKSYTVASMASDPQLPDLVGMYMKVYTSAANGPLDLLDHSGSHYFVTVGTMTIRWDEGASRRARQLSYHDSIWVAPYVAHAFIGDGALIKLGNGENCSYLDQLEMTNTFDLAATLKGGRKNLKGWGYDEEGHSD